MQNAEYLVVLEVVGRARGRDRDRMYRALRGRTPGEIDAGIASLEQAGLIAVKGKRIHASPGLKRLDELNLIGI